jgi:hypothetical protein
VREDHISCVGNKLEMYPGWSSWLVQGRHDAFLDPDKWLLTARAAVHLRRKKHGAAISHLINKQIWGKSQISKDVVSGVI